MKKGLKAALYDPYLDTLGGGEKHVLSILKFLEDEGYKISIFWDENLQNQIENRFGLQFINKLKFLPNIFNPQRSRNPEGFIKKIIALKDFDIFFYVTDGSYFFSSAKRNFVFCMVPNKKLYKMNHFNQLKTFNYRFLSNSFFTQHWIKQWGITSQVIYPYLNKEFIDIKLNELKKENIILSTGRFFSHLHSKKQSEIINLFKEFKLKKGMFNKFKLILAGGLKEEDKPYFNTLGSLIKKNTAIVLKANLRFKELLNLYKKSLIYIHMTGYGIDETKHPEMVEHLGITPLEAMASGCLTFCYNAGGPKEIIKDGQNGFLYNDNDELIKKLSRILNNQVMQYKIRSEAKKFIEANFTYEIFKKRVLDVLNL